MKITIDEDHSIVIGEVFSGAYIETEEGNRIGFCLRDDTIEFNVLPKDGGKSQWHRVNMQTLEVEKMSAVQDPDGGEMSDRNCAVRERTGDGVSVGRCWFWTNEKSGVLTCPRHGNVTEIQKHFSTTRELGEDPR